MRAGHALHDVDFLVVARIYRLWRFFPQPNWNGSHWRIARRFPAACRPPPNGAMSLDSNLAFLIWTQVKLAGEIGAQI
jgi:hypothetical protein